jgi:glucose-6-phosphate isomerase
VIQISKADEFHYGYLFIWLAKAAMMSAYLLKLNPFDQPGVELYKDKMFELLRTK